MIDRPISLKLFRFRFTLDKLFLLRLAVVLGVVLTSGLLAVQASSDQLIIILVLILGIIGMLIFLRWPPLGLLLASVAGMLIPYTAPGELNSAILVVAGLTALWLLRLIVGDKTQKIIPSRTVWPALALVITSILAFGVGQFPWYRFVENASLDAQLAGLGVFLLSVGAFFLAANQMEDIKWLQIITWVFIGLGGLFVFGRIIPGLDTINSFIFFPQSIGGMFWAWLAPMAFSQAAFNRKLHPAIRGLLILIVVASFYTGYVQNSRWKSGWVPPVFAMFAVITARSPRAGIVLAILAAWPLYLLGTDAVFTDEYSVNTRIDAWIILAEIIKANPILGLGFSNYYWYTPLFPIRGFAVEFNSHNNFVDIIAQTGFVGLLCFLWLFGELAMLGWRLIERVPEGFPRAYVYGAIGGLAGTMVAAMLGDWVLPFIYNIGLGGFRTGVLGWLFLGGLVFLEMKYIHEPAAENHESNI